VLFWLTNKLVYQLTAGKMIIRPKSAIVFESCETNSCRIISAGKDTNSELSNTTISNTTISNTTISNTTNYKWQHI